MEIEITEHSRWTFYIFLMIDNKFGCFSGIATFNQYFFAVIWFLFNNNNLFSYSYMFSSIPTRTNNLKAVIWFEVYIYPKTLL